MAFAKKVSPGDELPLNADGKVTPCPGCGTPTVRSKMTNVGEIRYCIYCKAEWEVNRKSKGFLSRQTERWEQEIVKGNEKWYENWRTVRKEVLERSNGCCEMCKTETRKLQVHHKKSPGEWGGDTLENLIALCDPCHNEAHRR